MSKFQRKPKNFNWNLSKWLGPSGLSKIWGLVQYSFMGTPRLVKILIWRLLSHLYLEMFVSSFCLRHLKNIWHSCRFSGNIYWIKKKERESGRERRGEERSKERQWGREDGKELIECRIMSLRAGSPHLELYDLGKVTFPLQSCFLSSVYRQ